MSIFLERARCEVFEGSLSMEDERFARFAGKCWQEILAVVAAADKLEVVSHSAPHDEHCFQCTLDDALDALDKKAGER